MIPGVSRIKEGLYRTENAEATTVFGEVLASFLSEGAVLFLNGELGAGKTQLSKGIASGLGVKEPVTSPTFTIESVYEGRELEFFHYDLYRIESVRELDDLDIFDVAGTEGISAIEWGEPYKDEISPYWLTIEIARDLSAGDAVRYLTLTSQGEAAEKTASAFGEAVV